MRVNSLFIIGIVMVLVLLPILAVADPVVADDDILPFVYPNPNGPYEDDTVTVACAQVWRIPNDPQAQLESMKNMAIKAAEQGVEIILFGEKQLDCCTLTLQPDCTPATYAETLPGPSSVEMEKIARKYGAYIVYGFTERDDKVDPPKVYNSTAIIGPDGIVDVYRKIHPVYTEGVSRGYRPVAFNTKWGPIGVSVCSDNYGQPELARTYALMGCRLLLNPTRLLDAPGFRTQVFRSLCSRAMENFMFVATTNNLGKDSTGYSYYYGGSFIVGPSKGINYEPTVYAGPASDKDEDLVMATLDLKISDQWRSMTQFFTPVEQFDGEPTTIPWLWAELWGTADDELKIANEELEGLRADKQALIMQNEQTTHNLYIAIALAGMLLITTIAFAVVSFSRKKK